MTHSTRQLVWRRREWPTLTSSHYGAGWKPEGSGFESRESSFVSGSTCVSANRKWNLQKAPNTISVPKYLSIVKVIHRRLRVVYELEDLNGTPIDGQFYSEELTPLPITSRTTYNLNKILEKRLGRGILEMLVSWQGYCRDFYSWIPAASVKNITWPHQQAVFM